MGFLEPGPEAAAEHDRVLGPMAYGCEETRLLIPRPVWRSPVPGADRAVADMLEELAARRVQELPGDDGDLRAQLHEANREGLVGGPPSLDDVARRLALSRRSLQRRLTAEGRSFRGEVDDVRKQQAAWLLEDSNLALSEVAWLLGFSDPRPFTRAFRRWHGTTPSAWRAAP